MWEFWRGRANPSKQARLSSSSSARAAGASGDGSGDAPFLLNPAASGSASGLGGSGYVGGLTAAATAGSGIPGAGGSADHGGHGPRATPASTPYAGGRQPRRSLPVVNFKDLNLSVDGGEFDEDDEWDAAGEGEGGEDAEDVDDDPTNKRAIIARSTSRGGVPRPRGRAGGRGGSATSTKLIVIMVGLPGRGKTFLCNKLRCYLSWLGHTTAHFNVGQYRRMQRGSTGEVQDAAFFDATNKAGVEARNRALDAALADLMAYLESENGQVAIFDATNSTVERRQKLINTFHGKFQYLFIESICNDEAVLEANYRAKMRYSPDYQGVENEKALCDFKQRIQKYLDVYEPINDRRMHYIKVVDMVTGRGYMDVNRISGYIPGKIAFFLMQVCKAGMTAGQARRIWLTRHGESLYNTLGKIGGDSGLSARGQQYAQLLPEVLESRLPSTDELVSAAAAAAAATSGGDVATAARAAAEAAKAARQAAEEGGPPPVPLSVWTSTLRRTILTAKYLPYPKLRWKALDEIHAGTMDSMTYEEIAERFPEDAKARRKDKLRYRYPSGESYLDVVQRLEPVIAEIEREKECVLVVAHQAVLRAVLAYFLGVPLRDLPRIEVPLHTLVELQPRPDGTVGVTRIPVPLPIDAALQGTGGGVASSTGGGTHGGGSAGGEEHAAAAATAAVALTATGAALAATGAGAAAHHPHPLHLSRAGSSSAAAAAAAVGSGSASPADSGDGDGAAALLVGGRGAPAALGVGGVAGPARAPSLSAMLPAPKNLPLGTSPSGSPAAVAAVAAAAADDDANADAAKVAGSERLPSLTFPSTNPLYASGSDGAARFGGKASAAAAAPLPLPVIETGRPRRFSDASGLRGALSSPTAGSATSAAAAAAGAVSPFGGEAGGGRSGGGGGEGGGVATMMMAAIAGAGEADEGGDAAAAALAALALGGSPTDAKGGQPLSGA